MFRCTNILKATQVGLSLAVVIWCGPETAYAQSTYVGASVIAEVSRFGSNGFSESGGEAFGFALRVGTSITDRWGVDLEFTRPGEVEEDNPFAYLAGRLEGFVTSLAPGTPPPPGSVRPDTGRAMPALSLPFTSTTRRRYSTLTVMPYVRQPLGARADIVYLGGVAFVRTTSQMNFGGLIRLIGLPTGNETWVAYSAAPVVGADVRVSMTDRLKLVPGMRLLAVNESGRTGWVMRPSVGLQWAF